MMPARAAPSAATMMCRPRAAAVMAKRFRWSITGRTVPR
jgi:hypothetical protein